MIYMDNAATTPVKQKVLDKMLSYFKEGYANPAGIYSFSQKSKKAIEDARSEIAKLINAKPEEIYFTSGGSEGDNWALIGTAEAYGHLGNHIITTKIEHHAILNTCKYLNERGFEITYLDVDKYGMIDLEELKKAIRPDTILISVMFANNEIGTIEPIEQIGEIADEHNIFFHTDAVQAFGHIPIDAKKYKIDMMSVSGHKFHAPKGVGFFYMKESVKLDPFLHGGSQERGLRGGTHNVPGIVGMAEAAKIAVSNIKANAEKEVKIRDYMAKRISTEIPLVRLNGADLYNRLPNNLNVSFEFIEGESLLIMLDSYEIYASSGSACTTGSLEPSHVLSAIGVPDDWIFGSLRLSLSEYNTMEEADFVVDTLKLIVERLRDMSLLYKNFLKKGEINEKSQ